MVAPAASPGRGYKVERVLAEYGLEDLGDELERAWTATGSDRKSLRDLADLLNRRLLAAATADADGADPAWDFEHLYEILSADAPSEGARTEARRRLERAGVDVDDLLDDFVTHQAVRTYLTEGRGVSYERSSADRVSRADETVGRLLGRAESVIEDKLDQLRSTDRIALGRHRVSVRARVDCLDCGATRGVGELLDDGGCDCRTDRS